MMKDFPSCFGESGVRIADSPSSTPYRNTAQNLVKCVYHHHSQVFTGFITVTWMKHLIGDGLTIGLVSSNKESLGKVDIKPWLFSKKKGVKKLLINSKAVEIRWDLSSAKFGSSPEPIEGFYLTIAFNQEPCLVLGDSLHQVSRKVDPAHNTVLVARREYVSGKRLYCSKVQFHEDGHFHDLKIEYDPIENSGLVISIDSNVVLQVKHLKWKFRGNQSILIDGLAVEIYWDVYSWIFGSVVDHAIFLFRTRPSDLKCTGLKGTKDGDSQGLGFSFVLCAWKTEKEVMFL